MTAVSTVRGSRIAALGEAALVEGFALAGALAVAAEDPPGARAAWRDLPADVDVVFLTARAAEALGSAVDERPRPLTVVMPP